MREPAWGFYVMRVESKGVGWQIVDVREDLTDAAPRATDGMNAHGQLPLFGS